MPTVMERIVAELPEVIVVAVRPPCDSFGHLTSRGAYYRDEMVRYLKGRCRLDVACSSEHDVDRDISKLLAGDRIASPALNECETKNDIKDTYAFFRREPSVGRSCKQILREARHFVFRQLRKREAKACITTGPITAHCIWKILTRNTVQSWCEKFQCDSPRPGSVTIYERRDGYYDAVAYNTVPGEH